MTKEGIRLRCTNKRCRHEWTYKGKSKFYCACPSCKTSVKIPEARI